VAWARANEHNEDNSRRQSGEKINPQKRGNQIEGGQGFMGTQGKRGFRTPAPPLLELLLKENLKKNCGAKRRGKNIRRQKKMEMKQDFLN